MFNVLLSIAQNPSLIVASGLVLSTIPKAVVSAILAFDVHPPAAACAEPSHFTFTFIFKIFNVRRKATSPIFLI